MLEGTDDWVPLGALYGWAERIAAGTDQAQRRAIVEALTELIVNGLIVSGEVINGRGFVASNGSMDELVEQLELQVADGGPEDFLLWFANTEEGDVVAARLSSVEDAPQS